ncbi:MAG: DUF5795 family protein [Halodesulfurarchaeum sp.]
MAENRVVEGRMVTPRKLAEMIEDEEILEADEIADSDRSCPECDGNVLEVGYMKSVTEYTTGYKCQDCGWSAVDSD